MKPKPRVLIIENSTDVTGALKAIVQSACELYGFFDFEFIVPRNSRGSDWIKDMGFRKIHELPMKELSRQLSSVVLYIPCLLLNAFRLNKIIKRSGISLIHVNDLYNLLPIILLIFPRSIPYVCHIRFLPHHFPKWLFNFWLRLHLRYSEKIIVVSKRLASMLPRHPKITVIYDKPPIEEHPELPNTLRNGTFTFLYLSNFIQGKGQDFAIRAFAKIHMDLSCWKLRFVGGDMGLEKNRDYIIKLKQLVEELNVVEKIEWVEFTKDVEREYKQADIILNFSESESFSMTCLEALYFGRPLIATDCGGPSEIVDNGTTGILVANRSVEDMAMAMKGLANSQIQREEMGLAARQEVHMKFSSEKTSMYLKDVFSIAMKSI